MVAGVVRLTAVGEIAREQWLKIPGHFSNVHLDEFVIMPNHMHGILVITEDDVRKGKAFDRKLPKFPIKCFTPTPTTPTAPTTPTTGSMPESIPAVVQNFKSITSRRINKLLETPGATIWQRNYYEHIIRDEADYARVVGYIRNNPQKWERIVKS